jgi:hypothetical protein
MKRRILRLSTLIVALASVAVCRGSAQQSQDWKAVEAEALKTLQGYVRINTSNPPGDVVKAADFLAGVLKREGIDVKRYESGPGRSILLARLKGNGTGGKAILLESHMDVVPPIRPAGRRTRSARRSPTARCGAAARST